MEVGHASFDGSIYLLHCGPRPEMLHVDLDKVEAEVRKGDVWKVKQYTNIY